MTLLTMKDYNYLNICLLNGIVNKFRVLHNFIPNIFVKCFMFRRCYGILPPVHKSL